VVSHQFRELKKTTPPRQQGERLELCEFLQFLALQRVVDEPLLHPN
jgi:hypothetical protein